MKLPSIVRAVLLLLIVLAVVLFVIDVLNPLTPNPTVDIGQKLMRKSLEAVLVLWAALVPTTSLLRRAMRSRSIPVLLSPESTDLFCVRLQ